MKHVAVLLAAAAIAIAGGATAVALGGNPHGQPPGQGECSHGATGKECKPDPQPGHGKDCEEHGKHGGVNEDHCTPTDTTPTDTTPTDTTPTTPTDTTPTTPTETTPTTPTGERCPPGMTPTAGKDGKPGNDECEFPPTTTPPATVPPTSVPPAVVTPPTTTTAPPVTTTAPPKPVVKPKPKPKVVVVVKPKPKAKPKQPKLTGNPKTDKCKDTGHGTLNCKGVTVIQGSG